MSDSIRSAIGYSGGNSLMPDACCLIPAISPIHNVYRSARGPVMDAAYGGEIR